MSNRSRGFTLAETVMALSITLVIGLALTGVTAALSNAQAHSENYYEHLHSTRAASNRLQATLRKARMVIAASPGGLLIWTHDDNDPGEINLSEILGVYRDPVRQRLVERSVVFPPGMSEELRRALDEDIELHEVIATHMVDGSMGGSSQYLVERPLANDVRGFRVYCDAPAPLTRMVRFSISVGDNANPVTLQGAGTLRAARIADIGQKKDGNFFLLPPDDD